MEEADLAAVLVEQTVPHAENPDDKVTIGVLDLTARGKVMVLRFVVTPRLSSKSAVDDVSLFGALGGEGFRPRLVDAINLKEYRGIQQQGGGLWQSDDLGLTSVNGTPMLAWAYFSAPEDDVPSMDLRVGENVPAFTAVPITR